MLICLADCIQFRFTLNQTLITYPMQWKKKVLWLGHEAEKQSESVIRLKAFSVSTWLIKLS